MILGDLLFNRTNSRELVGKTGLYKEDRQAIYAGYLVRFRMAGSVSSDYANFVMNSSLHAAWCREVKTDAIGQSNINATKLSMFRFPLPPLPEQKAIVAKVKKLLALCDQLEHEISQNQCRAEQLMQTVLSEAFSQPSEQTTQPAAVPVKRVMKQGELFLKLPAAQTGISPLLLQAEQQGFSTETPSFPCSSL